MLYLVGTPIGNLEDMTFRGVRTLQQADLIAAEDTRVTQRLLQHFDIRTPTVSYHEHNKAAKGAMLLEQLQSGKTIALVTDAGMPAISDPGEDLVRLCIENGIDVTVVPAATAFTTGLVLSGLPTDHFAFEGFLPVKQSQRLLRLEQIKGLKQTVILYEAPHRLLKTLQDLQAALGNRRAAICRELTKKFEQCVRGTLDDAIAHFTRHEPKGEFVLVLEGAGEVQQEFHLSLAEHVQQKMDEGMDKKTAIAHVAKLRNVAKREVYAQVVEALQ